MALLTHPCDVPLHRISYKPLKELIGDVGPESAPAYGWVRQLLPLIHIPDDVRVCSETHQSALYIYRLLWSADKALRKKDPEACYQSRKKLKDADPDLYQEYFAMLNGYNR